MKKILSIVLAACATLALVTGCSGTNVTVPSVTVPSEIESLVSEGKEIVNDLNIAVPTKDRAGSCRPTFILRFSLKTGSLSPLWRSLKLCRTGLSILLN